MQKNKKLCVLLGVSFVCLQSAWGQKLDPNVARQCSSHLLRYERQHQIPTGLLFAIAQTESGRILGNGKGSAPWPWTINVQGKSMYFSTKAEAITEVSRFLKQGIRNIDIGCMQINYHHHGHRFPSIVHMFDPKHNVEYGAKFLKDLRRDHGSWTKAVGLYHSATPSLQLPYKKKVYIKWQQEQKRLFQEEFVAAESSLQTQRLYQMIPTANPNFTRTNPVIMMAQNPSNRRVPSYYSTSQQELARMREQRESSSVNSTPTPQFFKKVGS